MSEPPAPDGPIERDLERLAERYALDPGSVDALRTILEDRTPLTPARTPRAAPPSPIEGPRYERVERLGAGGMGEVWRVRDRRLARDVAMKIIAWDLFDRPGAKARFLREAQITARLRHPGVVAIHDQGVDEDGRLWYVMREVRGRTLREVVHEARDAAGGGAAGGWSPRRLLDAFARICQTMAYVHGEGVIHRDLKPSNVMVGDFGEIQVMDWGLARRLDAPDLEPGASAPGRPERLTLAGQILGTPAYLAPERAAPGGAPAAATDVYALGAILYHLLTGRPPYRGTAEDVIQQLRRGPPLPLRDAVGPGARPPDPGLVQICERAMARAPGARFESAARLAQAVVGWLDGARREDRVREDLARAAQIGAEAGLLRREIDALAAELASATSALQLWSPVGDRRPGWALEDRIRRLRRDATVADAREEQLLRRALQELPDHPEVNRRLSEVYRRRLLDAEARRDAEDTARQEVFLRAHAHGDVEAWLTGDGRLDLVTEPPGAEVTLYRYVERDRRLAARRERALGRTPLRGVSIPRGGSALRIELAGHAPVTLPIRIGRQARREGRGPGGEVVPIHLPRQGELGADERYVPAGWFQVGGDPHASEPLPAGRVWADGFAICEHPVTVEAWLAFLNARQARGEPALPHVPTEPLGGAVSEGNRRLMFERDGAGIFRVRADAEGVVWDLRWPVSLVSWRDARAYAAWRASETGLPWRLPHELEWEKAARGVDGRVWPWGDAGIPAWANVAGASEAPPQRCPVDHPPTDRSVYGVRGLVGNVRDWCANAYARSPEWRAVPSSEPDTSPALAVIRGGNWSSALNLCRPAGRFAAAPDQRFAGVGLRLVRSLPG